uniref:Uncharacterized protein n=1 Tax=Aegilops tauschii subsp. strangulata TaxID=200361 RepID=A0A453BJJ0_AEGTS
SFMTYLGKKWHNNLAYLQNDIDLAFFLELCIRTTIEETAYQRVSGSQGHQGPDGEGAHQDGVNALQPTDLHQATNT